MMMNVQNKHLQIKMTKIIVLNLVNILKHINMNNNVLYIVLKNQQPKMKHINVLKLMNVYTIQLKNMMKNMIKKHILNIMFVLIVVKKLV